MSFAKYRGRHDTIDTNDLAVSALHYSGGSAPQNGHNEQKVVCSLCKMQRHTETGMLCFAITGPVAARSYWSPNKSGGAQSYLLS